MHITMPTAGPYAAVAALLAGPLPIPPDAPPRAALAAEIERLIAILDILDGDLDLEETGDLEPSLAGSTSFDCDVEGDTADDEPSLGSLAAIDQRRWNEGVADDREVDDSDDEDGHDAEVDTWPNPLGARIIPGYVDGKGQVLSSTMRLELERVPTKRVRRSQVRP